MKFLVYGDGVLLAETAVLTNDDAALALNVDVTGVNRLRLVGRSVRSNQLRGNRPMVARVVELLSDRGPSLHHCGRFDAGLTRRR